MVSAGWLVRTWRSTSRGPIKPINSADTFFELVLFSRGQLVQASNMQEFAVLASLEGVSLDKNLEALGITLSEEDHAKVLQRIVKLGDSKAVITPQQGTALEIFIWGRNPLRGSLRCRSSGLPMSRAPSTSPDSPQASFTSHTGPSSIRGNSRSR